MRPALLAALLLVPSTAWPAAYYFLDAGTRALGRGGAFVAGNDDLSAQYYNPAALIHSRNPSAMLNMSGVSQYVMFDRADETGDPFEPVYNESPPLIIPGFGGSHTFGRDDLTVALGFYTPFAPDMSYPTDGPQRYSLTDTLVWQLYIGPSVAYRPLPWLTLGAGVSWSVLRAEEELTVAMCIKGSVCGDNTAQDATVAMAAWDKRKIAWNAGLLVEPTPWLSVGAGFVPPLSYHASGSITAGFGEDFALANFLDGDSFTDDDVTVLVNMPMITRLGVAVRPMPNLEIEIAGTMERWASTPVDCGEYGQGVCITDVDLTIETNPDSLLKGEPVILTDDIVLPTDYANSFSGRLGADWDINSRWTARAGGFFETSAVPAATQGVAIVDGFKRGYGVGGGVKIIPRLTLDAAFSQSFIKTREITDSEVRMIQLEVDLQDTASSGIINGKVVGNGVFASHLTMASVGLTWEFGELPQDG